MPHLLFSEVCIMMGMCCVVLYNEQSSGRPDQDDVQWHGRLRTCRQTTVSLVSSILLFAFDIHKTARIADGNLAAISTSSNVERTAFDAGVGGRASLQPQQRSRNRQDQFFRHLIAFMLWCDESDRCDIQASRHPSLVLSCRMPLPVRSGAPAS